MSSAPIRRTCTGSYVPTGRWPTAIPVSRVYMFAPWMPLWQGSIPASDPCSWIFSVIRARAGMSASSQRRPSM